MRKTTTIKQQINKQISPNNQIINNRNIINIINNNNNNINNINNNKLLIRNFYSQIQPKKYANYERNYQRKGDFKGKNAPLLPPSLPSLPSLRPYCGVMKMKMQMEEKMISAIDKYEKYQSESTQIEAKIELEVNDPKVIFNTVWNKLEEKHTSSNLSFPKEIIWLMGAPGAGKGTNTPFIQNIRGLTAPPIVMSDLLVSPEAKETKKKAGMVGDGTVLELLLEKLLEEQYSSGVIVDGFPRTQVQVECLKLLHSALLQINKKYLGSYLTSKFPRPKFRVVVLYISERESISRQLFRGTKVRDNNEKVRATGEGEMMEERPTDFSDDAARLRYKIFTEHYGTLISLREHFTFKIIQAGAQVEMVQRDLLDEFRYQGSLDLSEDTYHSISQLPMASDAIAHARQNLISRLDHYQATASFLFASVISLIQNEIYPVVFLHSHSGQAIFRSLSPIFQNEQARGMVVDVLTERGFQVSSDVITTSIPKSVNISSGEIISQLQTELVFYIHFDKSRLH